MVLVLKKILHFQIIKLLGVAPEHTMLTTPIASTVCSPIDFLHSLVSFQSLIVNLTQAQTNTFRVLTMYVLELLYVY